MMRRVFYGLLAFITAGLLVQGCGTDSGGPNPRIDGLQPDSGPPGTMVTIDGSGFSPEAANNTVTFGGTTAPVNSATESTIETDVPDGLSQGSVPVEVTVGDQTASGPAFTVEPGAPGISFVSPDSGTVGTEIRIKGMNFSSTASENTIEFDGNQAPVNSASPDELLTEVPQGATDGPISVTVQDKSTTGPEFDVITDGALQLVTNTRGSDKDTDGYTATVDMGIDKVMSPNDTTYFGNLEKGSHNIELSGITQNCSVSGSNPRDLSISAGKTTTTEFDVKCVPVANNQIVFQQGQAGGGTELVLINADGSNPQQLTNNLADDYSPAISHDGTKIAFTSSRNRNINIYMMDVDGSNLRKVTTSASPTNQPAWSPDDSKLAFVSEGGSGGSDAELFVSNADGSSPRQLTQNSEDEDFPDWSPIGGSITFQKSSSGGFADIYKINPDGSGLTRLTNNSVADRYPEWSPDGTRIVFASSRDGDSEIYTMKPDGSDVKQVTDNSIDDDYPSWSPDGSELVFMSNRDGNSELYTINADGSGQVTKITNNSVQDLLPSWSPVE